MLNFFILIIICGDPGAVCPDSRAPLLYRGSQYQPVCDSRIVDAASPPCLQKKYYISSGTQGRGSESGWDKWQPNKTCVMALILNSFTLIHTNCPWVSDDVFEQDCTSQLVAQAAQAKKTRKSNGAGTLRITCIKVWESNRFVLKARNLTNFSITLRVSQFY